VKVNLSKSSWKFVTTG